MVDKDVKKGQSVRLRRQVWDGDCRIGPEDEAQVVYYAPFMGRAWVRFKTHTHYDERTGEYGPGGPYQAEILPADLVLAEPVGTRVARPL
jgi:hypothetical protein